MPGHLPTPDLPAGAGQPAPELVAAVLDTVRHMLTGLIGADYVIGLQIDLDTSLDQDLELESIEFVALNDLLIDHYGGRIDFSTWLATKQLDEIIGLTVGDLVRFVASSLAAPVDPVASAT